MADCEILPICPYFNESLPGLEAVQDVMRKKYCRDDFASCARYIVCMALGREKVPPTLVPSQIERARDIIAKHKELARPDADPEAK